MPGARLSAGTLNRLRVPAPSWRAGPSDVRVAHLGPGPFHRAHQAAVTDLAVASGPDGAGWGIGAYAARGTSAVEALAEQDLLSSVLVRDPDLPGAGRIRLLGVLGAVGGRSGFAEAVSREQVSVATITVSEGHYPVDAARGLDRSDAGVMADLSAPGSSMLSLPGLLHAGLLGRWQGSGAPISVLSCDNLRSNGVVLRNLVTGFAETAAAPPSFLSWLASEVAFPCTLVDRLTPRPDRTDLADAAALLGATDVCAVVTEPGWEWVVEDVLAAPTPPWQDVGLELVRDVATYEQRKLVLLNAAHSLLVGWGLLLGYETVATAMQDPDLAALVATFQQLEGIPVCLGEPVQLAAYATRVRARLANQGLRHRLAQVAADSSLKLGERMLPLVRTASYPGDLRLTASAVATWMRLHDPLAPFDLAASAQIGDPRADAVRSALGDPDPEAAARAALVASGLTRPGDPEAFADRVSEVFRGLRSAPPRRVLQDLL